MTAQHPSSYIFSNAVKILLEKKLSVQRGKKRLRPGVMGVGKKHREDKEGSKAYCRLEEAVPDCFSYMNTRMQLIKLK